MTWIIIMSLVVIGLIAFIGFMMRRGTFSRKSDLIPMTIPSGTRTIIVAVLVVAVSALVFNKVFFYWSGTRGGWRRL